MLHSFLTVQRPTHTAHTCIQSCTLWILGTTEIVQNTKWFCHLHVHIHTYIVRNKYYNYYILCKMFYTFERLTPVWRCGRGRTTPSTDLWIIFLQCHTCYGSTCNCAVYSSEHAFVAVWWVGSQVRKSFYLHTKILLLSNMPPLSLQFPSLPPSSSSQTNPSVSLLITLLSFLAWVASLWASWYNVDDPLHFRLDRTVHSIWTYNAM